MKRSFNNGNISDDGDYDSSNKQPMSNSQHDSDNAFSALDYSATSDHSSTDSGSFAQQMSNASNSSKLARNNNCSSKNYEDDERRRIRRERNKMAAAKCRQKRVDQTNTLLEETQKLEAEQRKLKEDIQNYEKQKEELEFIMDSHLLHCNMKPRYSNDNSRKSTTISNSMSFDDDDQKSDVAMQIKSEDEATVSKSKNVNSFDLSSPALALKSENGKQFLILPSQNILTEGLTNSMNECSTDKNSALIDNLKDVETTKSTNVQQSENSVNNNLIEARMIQELFLQQQQQQQDQFQQLQQQLASTRPLTVVRPNFLPTSSHSALIMSNHGNNSNNVTTPTFFAIGLDSIMDGHTGLTPITGFSSFGGQSSQILITPVMSLPLDNVLNNVPRNNNDNSGVTYSEPSVTTSSSAVKSESLTK